MPDLRVFWTWGEQKGGSEGAAGAWLLFPEMKLGRDILGGKIKFPLGNREVQMAGSCPNRDVK